jgi:hypothetical protein
MSRSFWIPKEIDLKVAAQLSAHKERRTVAAKPFVTISREFGCDGLDLAQALVDALSEKTGHAWSMFSRTMLEERQEGDVPLSAAQLDELEAWGHSELQGYVRESFFGMPSHREVLSHLIELTVLLAQRGEVVFLGGGAGIITAHLPQGLHVRVTAPFDWRVDHYAKRFGKGTKDVESLIRHKHKERETFIKTYLNGNVADPGHYHLCLNNARLTLAQMVHIVLSAIY